MNLLLLLLIVGLVVFGLYYILSIRPEKIKGERELVIKGVPTLTRTGRNVRVKKRKKGVVICKFKRKVPTKKKKSEK